MDRAKIEALGATLDVLKTTIKKVRSTTMSTEKTAFSELQQLISGESCSRRHEAIRRCSS